MEATISCPRGVEHQILTQKRTVCKKAARGSGGKKPKVDGNFCSEDPAKLAQSLAKRAIEAAGQQGRTRNAWRVGDLVNPKPRPARPVLPSSQTSSQLELGCEGSEK